MDFSTYISNGEARVKSEYVLVRPAAATTPAVIETSALASDSENNNTSSDSGNGPKRPKLEIAQISNGDKVNNNKDKFLEKKKKKKGLNQKRPVTSRLTAADKLCPIVTARRFVSVECSRGDGCKFRHDVAQFVRDKPDDIGMVCPIFDAAGYCSYGLSCRFGDSHITADYCNSCDEMRWLFYKQQKPLRNHLSAEVQRQLWKRRYNFQMSESALARFDTRKAAVGTHSRSTDSQRCHDKSAATNGRSTNSPDVHAKGAVTNERSTDSLNGHVTANGAGEGSTDSLNGHVIATVADDGSTDSLSGHVFAISISDRSVNSSSTMEIAVNDRDTITGESLLYQRDSDCIASEKIVTRTTESTHSQAAAINTTEITGDKRGGDDSCSAMGTVPVSTCSAQSCSAPDVPASQYDVAESIADSSEPSLCGSVTGASCLSPTAGHSVGCVLDVDTIKLRPSEQKKIDWRGQLYLAPLTTLGNLPFRRLCRRLGADITCGEMALASALLQGSRSEWALVKRHCSESLFGVQICGNNPAVLTRCTQLLNETCDIDFIDLNMGCPIDLIYHQGAGSAMMRRQRLLASACRSMVSVSDVPVTLKMRTGVQRGLNLAHQIIPSVADWGISMVTVHGRSREQRYTRLADWQYIDQCARLADPLPLLGNGDVLSWQEHQYRVENSAVSSVMIGRGALIKPWLFTEIKEQRTWDIRSTERLGLLKEYANYGLEHWGSDTEGVERTRRFLLEWLSFLYRYIPAGLLESEPQRINERPPLFRGRDPLETLMASADCADWVKLSEMLLGPVPDNFAFVPKHAANSYSTEQLAK